MDEKPLPSQDPDGLGPIPEPTTEPREPNPGGADALPPEAENLAADLEPDDNAAVSPEAPGDLKEREDTDTEATKNGGDVPPEDESPA